MNSSKSLILLSIAVLLGMISSLFQPCFSPNIYARAYSLEKTDGSKYTLTLTIPPSLYQSYISKGHPSTLNRFVTPQIFLQVATQIGHDFVSNEDYANAILMITRQIPQPQGNVPLKYPVETIIDNIGDCDVFSVLAASLMKARGLDVVLLEYPDHMNLGVYLPYKPSSSRIGQIAWYPYNGRNYYVAETTGGVTEGGVSTPWRVGEDSGDYSHATIISLTDCDTSSPEQVAVSLALTTPPSAFSFPPIGYGLLAVLCIIVGGGFPLQIHVSWHATIWRRTIPWK